MSRRSCLQSVTLFSRNVNRCRNLCTLVWFCKRRLAKPAKIEEINDSFRRGPARLASSVGIKSFADGSNMARVPNSNFLTRIYDPSSCISNSIPIYPLTRFYFLPALTAKRENCYLHKGSWCKHVTKFPFRLRENINFRVY